MRYEDNCVEISDTANGAPRHCENDGSANCKCEPCRCRSRLAWPPDALTRLLMEADRVPEFVLDDLLLRVAAARAAG
jgi:hypothetical protein